MHDRITYIGLFDIELVPSNISKLTFTVSGRKVTAVDANGAGDAFAGAFLYALNAGFNYKTAAELAILISSEVVSQFGPRLANADYALLLQNFQKECA